MDGLISKIEGQLIGFAAKALLKLAEFETKELDARVVSLISAIKGGMDWEKAVTAELNTLFKDEVTEGREIVAAFLGFVGRLIHKVT